MRGEVCIRMRFFPSAAARSLLIGALLSVSCTDAKTVGATTAASALYSRADTNATTVWSPRLRVAGKVGESLGVETAVALDAWTGASVDVTTAATKAIHEQGGHRRRLLRAAPRDGGRRLPVLHGE
jgi:hypothetical protein